MRTTFNVAFYCRESKKGKDGKAAVEVSLSVNGERRFLNLPLKAEPKEFNKKRRNEEIEKIRTTEFSTEALKRIRDVFLVQTYTGLSFIDLEHLREEDIREKDGVYYIHKRRTKTGIYFTSVIIREGIEILQRYGYRLPIVSNQKTNSALKAIGREAEINKTMHTHLGRKTYGHLLLQSGVRIEAVAKALGHSDIKTTQKYYAELTEETTVKEIASMLK